MESKKLSKKVKVVVTIVLLLSLFFTYRTFWFAESDFTMYLEDYREYYFFSRETRKFGLFGYLFNEQIFIIPGRKTAMCEKIVADTVMWLDYLVEEHSDIYSKYELSDDFKYVILYVYPDVYYDLDSVNQEINMRIWSAIGLYHDIKGRDVRERLGGIIYENTQSQSG